MGDSQGDASYYDLLAKHYERLALKYEHAAKRPWLSIEPDEPRPLPRR